MKNWTMSELYTDDKQSKYPRNPNDILKSTKNLMKSFIQKRWTFKTTIAELLSKISQKNFFSNRY